MRSYPAGSTSRFSTSIRNVSMLAPWPSIHVLDPEQIAVAVHLADQRDVGQGALELIPQARPAVPDALHELLRAHRRQHGEADGTGERRPVPRVSEGEAARPVRHRFVD